MRITALQRNREEGERKLMFMLKIKKRRLLIVAMAGALWTAPRTVSGQTDLDDLSGRKPAKFTTASVRGTYAIVGTYSGNIAQELGTQTVDSLGNFTGSSTLNVPGPNGQRIVLVITFEGTSTVNSDGSGTDTFTATLPDGSKVTRSENFVITRARFVDGELIATEIVGALREPSGVVPGGVFLTHTYTRLPDRLSGDARKSRSLAGVGR
jgi:hypothetical protein